jgi:ribosomal protein S18 acetylase RimI-like enzyme
MPTFRPGLGDDAERYVRLPEGYIEYRYAPGGTCEIVNIEVQAERRGQGVGRRLLGMLFAEVKGKAGHVYAITRADNLIAHEFYEHTRFYVVGVLRRFYGDDKTVDAVMFGRKAGGPV